MGKHGNWVSLWLHLNRRWQCIWLLFIVLRGSHISNVFQTRIICIYCFWMICRRIIALNGIKDSISFTYWLLELEYNMPQGRIFKSGCKCTYHPSYTFLQIDCVSYFSILFFLKLGLWILDICDLCKLGHFADAEVHCCFHPHLKDNWWFIFSLAFRIVNLFCIEFSTYRISHLFLVNVFTCQ